MFPLNFDTTGMSMGEDIGGFGQPAATPVRAPMPMNTGTPLTSANGMMPQMGAPAGGAVAPAAGGKFGNFLSNFSNVAEGLSGLGQLYIGLKSLGIAKDQLAFSKEAYRTNLANQTKSYNTALEDRIRSRYVTEGRSSADADAYLARNNM